MNELDRRTVLRGAGAAGALAAATPLLAACGSGSNGGSGSGGGTPADPVTVASSEVAVGSGVITGGVVVTQPQTGSFKAFSSTCTHQSCTVASVSDNVIDCTCHGSKFSAEDGSVIQGPATVPLPARTATVKGADVVVT